MAQIITTNCDFLIPISLQPNVAYLRYFKHINSVRSNNKSEISMVYINRLKRYRDKKI